MKRKYKKLWFRRIFQCSVQRTFKIGGLNKWVFLVRDKLNVDNSKLNGQSTQPAKLKNHWIYFNLKDEVKSSIR